MSMQSWLPLLILAGPLTLGVIIFMLPENSVRTRTTLNLLAALIKLGLVGWMIWHVYRGQHFESRIVLMSDFDLAMQVGPLSVLFLGLSSVLWLATTIYAVGYLEGSPHRSRFFGFFSLCVAATAGVAMASNLFTFLLFYELLTLATYPLIVHRGTDIARRAGQTYLVYTIGGGTLLLVGTVWLYTLTGTLEFAPQGGFVRTLGQAHHADLTAIFMLLIVGLGVKAALVPLHSWLPQAMVAPAPVSALLHAVAVVKAGVFGIVRVLYDVFGIEFAAQELGVTTPLAIIAAVTILYGSLRALFQDDLKRRLAFSTVSQVSYITLGIALAGPLAAIGGLVHLVHQGLMKITLFFCAGNLAETLDIHKISEMKGVGQRMPFTMAAFTLAALGMIGMPPIAGFISKWYLGLGALQMEQNWVIWILIASTLLNAAYFLPIIYAVWFCDPPVSWLAMRKPANQETTWALLLPPVATALLSLAAGMLAALPYSPLEWALFIIHSQFWR